MSELTIVLPPLHDGQQDVADDDARFKIVVAGRRWGKTRLGVRESLKIGLEGGRGWWVAPTYKLAQEGWHPLRQVASEIPGSKVREADKELWLPNGGRVGVRSADNPDMLRGAGLDFVVLDEAAYQPERLWYEILRPALADRQGGALFISTPAGYNWFYDLWEMAKDTDNWSTFHAPTSSNPFIAESELTDIMEEVGSHVYAQEFLAQFVEVGGNVFKDDWFSYYREVPLTSTDDEGNEIDRIVWMVSGKVYDPREGSRFLTVDPAVSLKESADFTAMAACHAIGGDLFVLDVFRRRMEGPDILPTAYALADKWDIPMIYFEQAAFQLYLVQQAKRDGRPVKGIKADRDKLARAIPFAARMEAGRVHFRKGADWIGDLEKELLVFPDSDHDDQVDALAYASMVMGRRQRWEAY